MSLCMKHEGSESWKAKKNDDDNDEESLQINSKNGFTIIRRKVKLFFDRSQSDVRTWMTRAGNKVSNTTTKNFHKPFITLTTATQRKLTEQH